VQLDALAASGPASIGTFSDKRDTLPRVALCASARAKGRAPLTNSEGRGWVSPSRRSCCVHGRAFVKTLCSTADVKALTTPKRLVITASLQHALRP
jgi:hypothetical protein